LLSFLNSVTNNIKINEILKKKLSCFGSKKKFQVTARTDIVGSQDVLALIVVLIFNNQNFCTNQHALTIWR